VVVGNGGARLWGRRGPTPHLPRRLGRRIDGSRLGGPAPSAPSPACTPASPRRRSSFLRRWCWSKATGRPLLRGSHGATTSPSSSSTHPAPLPARGAAMAARAQFGASRGRRRCRRCSGDGDGGPPPTATVTRSTGSAWDLRREGRDSTTLPSVSVVGAQT
jgi:hypothetical protein